MKNILILVGCFMSYFSANSFAANDKNDPALAICVVEIQKGREVKLTNEQAKIECKTRLESPVAKRIIMEKEAFNNPFAMLPHKPNYILPFTYFNANHTPYSGVYQDGQLDDVEAKFQVSIKNVIAQDVFTEHLDILAAFTATSWWQAYNTDLSSPFRETNYEPELIISYYQPWSLFGLPVANSTLSFNHQSNGQTGTLSRSWNRIIGGIVIADDNLFWSLKTWWRIPEETKTDANDPSGDDNPNIEKYMGYGELGVLWKVSDKHNIDILLRNNLRSDNKGAIKIGWSFPFTKHMRGYVEYFSGYGESLIYYNENVSRIGIGVKLTDWL